MKNNTPLSHASVRKHIQAATFLPALFLLAGLIPGLSLAQSTFTTASGNQSWGTSSNWSPSGVPNGINTAVMFNAPVGGNEAINSFGTARTVGYMTVTNDSGNTFSITTNNTLNFDVSTGDAALTIAGAGDNLTTFASTLSVVLNDTLDLSVTNTASSSVDGALKINGVISGSGRIIKTGAGIATFTGTNIFTGGLTISAGTIRISSGSSLGAAPASYVADQVVINGGTLEYTGSGVTSSSTRGFSLGSGTGTISVTGSGAYQIGAVIADVSGQSGVLRKTGAGILYLNPDAASTFSGGTTIVSGTLQFGISGSVGAGAITLGASGGGSASLESVRGGYTLANNITVASGSGGVLTLYYSGTGAFNSTFSGSITLNDNLTVRSDAIAGQAMRLTGAISGSNNITKTGTGTLRLENNNTSYSGTTTISAGTLQLGNAGTTGAAGTGAIVNNGTLIINRTNTLTLSNDMSGTGSLVQAGTGTTTISNSNNTYSGGTIVASGTLQTGRTGSLGTGDVTLGSVGGGDATLDNNLAGSTVANNITTIAGSGGALTLSMTGSTNFTSTFSGALTLNDNLVIRSEAATGFAMRMTGAITGANNITKTGAGVLRLENNNTGYSGTTTISTGTVQLGNAGTTGGIGTGAIVNNAALLLVRSNALVLANQISGTGTLTQSGTGATTLSNANTYSGATAVTAGALMVTNTSGSATGTGSVSVASGTTLGGTGVISPTGSNNVQISGTLAPGVTGTSVGTLTFTPVNGNVIMQSGSVIVFELSAGHTNDKIVFNASGSGAMDFSAMTAGSISVTFTSGYTPSLNDSFDLLDWAAASGAGMAGLNSSLLNLSTIGFDPSWSWDTSLFGTTGVITVTAAVPEPSRLLFGTSALIALLMRRRRCV